MASIRTNDNDATYVARPEIHEPIKFRHKAPQSNWERFTSPVVRYVAEDLARATYNRLRGESKWKGRTVTKEELPGYFVDELKDQVQWLSDKHFNGPAGRFIHFTKHPNDTVQIPFTGDSYRQMYGAKYADGKEGISNKLSSGRGQVEHTLGAYNIYATKDGDIIKDTYDFNVGQGQYTGTNTPYTAIRRFVGQYGSKSNEPNEGKIRFNINLPR